jgi:hippurate hydrolase
MPHRNPLATSLLFVTILTITLAISPARADEPTPTDPWIAAHLPEFLNLYKHLHQNPELSYQESETSKRIAEELKRAGAQVTQNVGGFGVVGLLANGPGPTVLVRTDMDALPIVEETGLPYASTKKAKDKLGREVGVMHACGHDVHMSTFIATARWLADHKNQWSGTILFIGQPAEEMIGGARSMLEAGLYSRFPKPDYCLALHCVADGPIGSIGYCPGPMLASSTSLTVTTRGKGGHGAWPHRTVDPIVLAALAVLDFQTIVSREIEPAEPAVLTVGSIHGGTKHNIISSEVKLQITLRAFSESVRKQLIDGIDRRVNGLAKAHAAPNPSVELEETTPATINSTTLVERILPAFTKALGDNNVIKAKPVMGAEDFGLFGKPNIPICMFWLGTIEPERLAATAAKGETMPALHSSKYYPEPKQSITTGIKAMTAAILELLPPK